MEKKYGKILISLVLVFMPLALQAQDSRLSFPKDDEEQTAKGISRDSTEQKIKSAYLWTLDPITANRIPAVRDSSRINFHKTTLAEGADYLVQYLGNIGTPLQSKNYFNRSGKSRFSFFDHFAYWQKTPSKQLFANRKIPFSNLHYQTGGGAQSKEEYFKAELNSSFGKKLNLGFDVDYMYTRGYYANNYNKQINYDFNGSYIADKYKMHFFFGHNNYNNTENGGITDPMYITDPDNEAISGQGIDGSLGIPVRIVDKFWNRLRGTHFFVSNRYDIGDDMEQYLATDSVMRWRRKKDYVAPASVILTTHYQDQRRTVKTNSNSMDDLYGDFENIVNGELKKGARYPSVMNDYMSYYSFKNTLALSMNEGFRRWMKFGLTAFVAYDNRKYLIPDSNLGLFGKKEGEQAIFIGGELSSSNQARYDYRVFLEKDLKSTELTLEAEFSANMNLKDRRFEIRANAHLLNRTSNYFEDNFSTKYWAWNTDLKDTRQLFFGGEILSPSTGTKLKVGLENVTDQIYYNSDRIIAQHSGDVRVLSVGIEQKLKAGIFHWDNYINYQTTSKEEVIPLPELSFHTNVYILTKIAKVLTLQLGAEAHFHTKYYVPGYEPLTMQFFNQRDERLGNFPMTTVYANLHLKNTRFFVMLFNAAEGLGNSEYFPVYRYPANPRIIKFGLSWNFNN